MELFGEVESGARNLIVGVGLVGDEALVVRVLNEYLAAADGDRIVGKRADHGLSVVALLELEKGLILAAQVEHVDNIAEYEAELDDLDVVDLLRYVTYVHDFGGHDLVHASLLRIRSQRVRRVGRRRTRAARIRVLVDRSRRVAVELVGLSAAICDCCCCLVSFADSNSSSGCIVGGCSRQQVARVDRHCEYDRIVDAGKLEWRVRGRRGRRGRG